LLWTKEQLSKPNEYYQKIHPMEAAETDERRVKELAEAQAKAAAAAAKAAQTASPAPGDASGNGASAAAKPATAVHE
jgi:RPA family protein